MNFISLISGSSGNASLISYKNTNLLIDCGASGKALEKSLLAAGTSIQAINAVLLTHEHSDHIKGVGVLARRYGFPIYATRGTLSSLTKVGEIADTLKNNISAGNRFDIGDIEITPFNIHHDAAEPVGYSFMCGDDKYAIATDTGHVSRELLNMLKGSRAVILESNHDIEMLRCGPYPFHLQQRILSDYGHLSNEAASETALALVRSGTEHIALGHLSEHNNLPEIALLETNQRLTSAGVRIGMDVTLQIAKRHEITRIIDER